MEVSFQYRQKHSAAEKMFLGLLKFDIWELFMFVLDSLFSRYNFSFGWLIQLLLERENQQIKEKN